MRKKLDEKGHKQVKGMTEFCHEHHLPLKTSLEAGRVWAREGLREGWEYLDRVAELEERMKGAE